MVSDVGLHWRYIYLAVKTQQILSSYKFVPLLSKKVSPICRGNEPRQRQHGNYMRR